MTRICCQRETEGHKLLRAFQGLLITAALRVIVGVLTPVNPLPLADRPQPPCVDMHLSAQNANLNRNAKRAAAVACDHDGNGRPSVLVLTSSLPLFNKILLCSTYLRSPLSQLHYQQLLISHKKQPSWEHSRHAHSPDAV